MSADAGMIATEDQAAVAQFLDRLLRLDPGVHVRLRPDPDGSGTAWAMLPFRVLVGRRLTAAPPSDVTVSGASLAAWLRGVDAPAPARRDEAWRWPLPPSEGEAVEIIPVGEVVRLAEAAARTVRSAIAEGVGGRAVGERALRDALLDHVAIVVTTAASERVEVQQRLVQALVRTGLLAGPSGVMANTMSAESVTVRRVMAWIGMSSRYGSAWYRPISPLRLS